jgi:arylformamidase
MKAEWTDITVALRPGVVCWPGDPPFESRAVASVENGDGANVAILTIGSHTGTHMDAPRHFFTNGAGLDTMPLDAVVGPARIIESRDPESIKAAELQALGIRAGDRLLFKTRNSSARWDAQEFTKNYVSISPDAAHFLVERRVRCVGIDYLSVGGIGEDGKETHETLLGAGIWIIEGLDLSHVAAGEVDLVCLPLRILESDGAPARAIVRPRRRSRAR